VVSRDQVSREFPFCGQPICDGDGDSHIDELRTTTFAVWPHPFDARQRELDIEFSREELFTHWLRRVTELRERFLDFTRFCVAREFLAWLVRAGRLPSRREAVVPGVVSDWGMRAHRTAVQAVAADILVVPQRVDTT
jgi:hypothetical protein